MVARWVDLGCESWTGNAVELKGVCEAWIMSEDEGLRAEGMNGGRNY